MMLCYAAPVGYSPPNAPCFRTGRDFFQSLVSKEYGSSESKTETTPKEEIVHASNITRFPRPGVSSGKALG